MKKKSLLPKSIVSQEDKEKKNLQEAILKKRQRLVAWITKNEMLRVELDMVSKEYHLRVGSLYLKSNQQDLEIIYFQNLLELLQEGFSYEDALKKLDKTYYGQQKKLEEEKEKLRWEKEIFNKHEEPKTESEENDIKKLWKFLVAKFHPDLIQDPKEKKRLEEIMKKVNQAYEEKNYNALLQLKNEVHVELYEESSIEKLTEILIDIENEIIQQELLFAELRQSQWYSWKLRIQRAKKDNIDIFVEIEKPLLDEIVRNEKRIERLKAEIETVRNGKKEFKNPIS